MNRRQFLGIAGLAAIPNLRIPKVAGALQKPPPDTVSSPGAAAKAFGSGHFGEWIEDSYGLAAYRYTCNQISDPKAVSPVNSYWRSPTDHTHQVGNDRLVAAVSNYGYVQVRQDEGSPKFLNDYSPGDSRYGGGIGFLSDGENALSTYYPGGAEKFDRIFGQGYFRKIVRNKEYEIDQTILAPFGDDPVLVSAVLVTNHRSEAADLRWIEYWCCLNYQFSYRSWMQASVHPGINAADLRRRFAGRFSHQFRELPNHAGLIESQKFLGRSEEDARLWAEVEASLEKNPTGFLGGPIAALAPGAAFEDIEPPATFLASLDAPAEAFTTNGAVFLGKGGIARPDGLDSPLDNSPATSDSSSAHILERRLRLTPGASHQLFFLYGYLPQGFDATSLISKYAADPAKICGQSCASWKNDGVRLSVPSEPWVERETSWHNYYLRSNLTYDKFFGEPILSQGHVYQYIIGFQGAARDPLQHALPFVFSRPEILRSVIRYTLKEIQADGSIPYGIVGNGVPMPVVFRPSDLEMWVLWAASEYVLGTRDEEFLDETIPAYPASPASEAGRPVRELLRRCYSHLVNEIGVGEHGLMRLSNGDWNDEVVVFRGSTGASQEVREKGESVLNAAMACYVLDYYARMLEFAGDTVSAAEPRAKAEAQRTAVRAAWEGDWFRRAWLGADYGWIGEDHLWLEPQPWAVIGGAATPSQRQTLTSSIHRLVREPSLIGAMVQSKGDPAMHNAVGTMTNGGVWPSINGTLIWALALEDGAQAWDEWKKNCLALHADVYPDIWYGIWSGPDTYNSILSRHPGQTMFIERTPEGRASGVDQGLNWTDYPVMNMHPHAWPLYSAAKLLGLEFNEKGLRLRPTLPMAEYEFRSPLLGFKKSRDGYSGWYGPSVDGVWEIELLVPAAEADRFAKVIINGEPGALRKSGKSLHFLGKSKTGEPLHWELERMPPNF